MSGTLTDLYTREPDSAGDTEPYSRFDTEREYRLALAKVINLAKSRICILDHDLYGMGLDTVPACEALTRFFSMASTSELYIAVHDTAFLLNSSLRLRSVLQRHSQQVLIRQLPEAMIHLTDSHLLADGNHGVRRFHNSIPRGALFVSNPAEADGWWRRFNELWEQCPAPIPLNNAPI